MANPPNGDEDVPKEHKDREDEILDAGGDTFFLTKNEEKEKLSSTSMHVEGLNFDDREDEILAMGGDPFFLNDDNVNDGDGDVYEEEEEDAIIPSMSFMSSMMNSTIATLPSVLDFVEKKMDSSSSSTTNPIAEDKSKNAIEDSIKSFEEQQEELLELGGDPFFLDGADDEVSSDDNNSLSEEDDSGWDGVPIEDAHEDFY